MTEFGTFVEDGSLVAPRTKIVYVPTPKVACTSLKWLVARAEGTVREVFAVSHHPTRDQVIHNPTIHGLSRLAHFGAEERSDMLSGAEWVRFCVTRDPYGRLVSAWANRVLLQPADAWGEMMVDLDGVTDFGEGFRAFVRHHLTEERFARDPHFIPQVDIVVPDHFPYTHIVDIADLSVFLDELRSSGGERERIGSLTRTNEGVPLTVAAMYDAPTARIVEQFYAADFARFGYRVRGFSETAGPLPMSAAERALAEMVRARIQRINDFSNRFGGSAHS